MKPGFRRKKLKIKVVSRTTKIKVFKLISYGLRSGWVWCLNTNLEKLVYAYHTELPPLSRTRVYTSLK